MIYVFAIICILMQLLVPYEKLILLGVDNLHLTNAFFYMFAHISWLHLAINLISLGIMYKPINTLYQVRYNSTMPLAITAYIGAVSAAFVCATDIPTLGASGIVFFLLGLLIMLNPTKKQAANYLWVVAAIIIQIAFGKSNVALHITAFVFGALYVIGKEAIKRLYEYRGIHQY